MAEDVASRFRFCKGFFVGVHTSQEPSREAWSAHCLEAERRCKEVKGVLVYTDGGGPDSRQREELRRAFAGKSPITAIVTASASARGIVTGLNWFFREPRIKAFSPQDLEGALEYLGQAGPVPRGEVLHTLEALAAELGVELPFVGV
jgi:hypothetical protein